MALVTITAVFGRADTGAAKGWLSLAPWLDAVYSSPPDMGLITRAQVREPLDEYGTVQLEVLASDDPEWQTSEPVPYLAKWTVSGSYGERIVLIPGPGPWSLWELVDVADPPTITPTPVPGPVGPVGPVGPEGPQGEQGEQGIQGIQGQVSVAGTATGNPGTAATVTDSDASIHKAALNFTIPRGTVVAVGPTVTGAPGTSAAVVDGDAGVDVRLDFTIPRGDTGATGPAIGGLLTTKGDLAARDATAAVRLGVGANGTVLVADSAATTGVKWGQSGTVGNLLTDNQASVETDTTGFLNFNATLTRSSAGGAAHGTYALLATSTHVNYGSAYIPTNVHPVVPGDVRTGSVAVKNATGSRTLQCNLMWYTAGGAQISKTLGTTAVAPSGWTTLQATGVAPATAAFVSCEVSPSPAGAVGDSYYADRWGLWAGAGGDWAMPGTPITNLGYQVTHPNVDDVLVQEWDTGKGRWQTVWYDSGVRQVSCTGNWTGSVRLRRLGSLVFLTTGATAPTMGASATAMLTLPAGFQCPFAMFPTRNTASGQVSAGYADAALNYYGTWGSGQAILFGATYGTNDAIPVTLPGTLVSAAPA